MQNLLSEAGRYQIDESIASKRLVHVEKKIHSFYFLNPNLRFPKLKQQWLPHWSA